MVTSLTNYIKQRYAALSTDDLSGLDVHNGDELLEMDTGEVYVFDEENRSWTNMVSMSIRKTISIKITNSTGVSLVFVTCYENTDGYYDVFIYVSVNNGSSTTIKVLMQNRRVQFGYTTNKAISSVSYNGQPVTFANTGTGSRRYLSFDIPENFDPAIPFIIT